jgi:hypothetical protein
LKEEEGKEIRVNNQEEEEDTIKRYRDGMNSSVGRHRVDFDAEDASSDEGLNDRSGKPKPGARKKQY